FRYVDRCPDVTAQQQVERMFQRLTKLDSEVPLRFRFADEAQELFVLWLEGLESELRGGQHSPVLMSHLSKYRSLMPSLALLFELADIAARGFDGFEGLGSGGGSRVHFVSIENTCRAMDWCAFLQSHAGRVYSCAGTPAHQAAEHLA